jgi:carbonic anhydrase/acetyltransferase-like protein (isoleucine patch superfamily)
MDAFRRPVLGYRDRRCPMIRSFNGKTPKIHPSAFVSEAAYVVGDVEIGEGCSVWPHAVIRGDTGRIVLGRNVAVEDCCALHAGIPPYEVLRIGDNVNIGHGAVVHAVSIGHNCLVGMNATILHKASIGSYCLIGAGALVSEGMAIPDYSFVVGVPAKVKAKVTEEQMWWLKDVPGEYAALGRHYNSEGLGETL